MGNTSGPVAPSLVELLICVVLMVIFLSLLIVVFR
jgi:hypothetical protein